jgi:hypothetical protein
MSDTAGGICLLVGGTVLMIFHRRLARRTVAYYQMSPEPQEKVYTQIALVAGIFFSGCGIAALFADHPAGLLFVLAGLSLIAFDKRWARQTLANQRSEKHQRIATFLVGLICFIGGLMTVLTRR